MALVLVAGYMRDAAYVYEYDRNSAIENLRKINEIAPAWNDKILYKIWENCGKPLGNQNFGGDAYEGKVNVSKEYIIKALSECATELESKERSFRIETVRINNHFHQVQLVELENAKYVRVIGTKFANYLGNSRSESDLKNYEIQLKENQYGGISAINFYPKVSKASQLNRNAVVDWSSWAITVVDTGVSCPFSPKTWIGHSVIIIEGVRNGHYFMHATDLIQESGRAKVRLFDSENFPLRHSTYNSRPMKVHGQTLTWLCSHNTVVNMIESVQDDIVYDRVQFEVQGGSSLTPNVIGYWWTAITGGFAASCMQSIAPVDDYTPPPKPHNCASWVREKLSYHLKIDLQEDPLAWLISSPHSSTQRTEAIIDPTFYE